MKKILIRFVNSFCYSIAITTVVQQILNRVFGVSFMLSEYAERFESEVEAYVVQLFLIGIISGINGVGSILMEIKRLGLVVQSILYLMLLLVTWIPIACYLWGFHKYATSMEACLISIFVSYGICWVVQYRLCHRDVEEINRRLQEK